MRFRLALKGAWSGTLQSGNGAGIGLCMVLRPRQHRIGIHICIRIQNSRQIIEIKDTRISTASSSLQ